MKKALSILLLLVFLFNVGGYYIVFWGLRLQTDRQLIDQLDANLYDRRETVELKIPVTLPYPIHSRDFQRINGQFEYGGEFYKLVKHKLQNDTLYVVCIRDVKTRELVNTMTEFMQLSQPLPATNERAVNFLSKLLKDFCSGSEFTILHQPGFIMAICQMELHDFLPQRAIEVSYPPPQM